MSTRYAVPSTSPGGLDAGRSGHFGRCDCFTLVDLAPSGVEDISVIKNPPHGEGGCLSSVRLLSDNGVGALVVRGIGARPLAGFTEAGIRVFYDTDIPTVRGLIDRLLEDDLPPIDPSAACQGH